MDSMKRPLVWVGVACLTMMCLIQESQSIRCFQCNSQYHPECHTLKREDNLTSVHYRECKPEPLMGAPPGTQMFCRKIVQKIIDRDNLIRTVRKCGWVMHKTKKDCYDFKNEGHEDVACQCFEDACNSARTVSSTVLLSSISTILLSIKSVFY